MGYTTEFTGQFDLDKPLTEAHKAYLQAFNRTRRMKRDASKLANLPDAVRIAAGLPVGDEGGYYVGSLEDYGQNKTADVIDYNRPPNGQPALWCQWTPSEDGNAIQWDEGEKFYSYVEWLKYLIEHFLAPWGYVVNGSVEWEGESRGDIGRILVSNNTVTAQEGKIVYS